MRVCWSKLFDVAKVMMSIARRVAAMPLHWRLLLGGQAVFMGSIAAFRLHLIKKQHDKENES